MIPYLDSYFDRESRMFEADATEDEVCELVAAYEIGWR